jgi:hypothetical protein
MLLVVRREAYEALPAVVRKIFAAAVVQADHELTLAVAAANARALAALAAAGRTVAPLPPALVGRLRALSGAVAAEGAGADALAARVRAGHDAAAGEQDDPTGPGAAGGGPRPAHGRARRPCAQPRRQPLGRGGGPGAAHGA